jgi:hypothetical protein
VRDAFLSAGFDRVVVWHTSLAKGHMDGREYATDMLTGPPSNQNLMKTLNEADQCALFDAMAAEAQSVIDAGAPIALDVVFVVARRSA